VHRSIGQIKEIPEYLSATPIESESAACSTTASRGDIATIIEYTVGGEAIEQEVIPMVGPM
jgi:hypothetical protein